MMQLKRSELDRVNFVNTSSDTCLKMNKIYFQIFYTFILAIKVSSIFISTQYIEELVYLFMYIFRFWWLCMAVYAESRYVV